MSPPYLLSSFTGLPMVEFQLIQWSFFSSFLSLDSTRQPPQSEQNRGRKVLQQVKMKYLNCFVPQREPSALIRNIHTQRYKNVSSYASDFLCCVLAIRDAASVLLKMLKAECESLKRKRQNNGTVLCLCMKDGNITILTRCTVL